MLSALDSLVIKLFNVIVDLLILPFVSFIPTRMQPELSSFTEYIL